MSNPVSNEIHVMLVDDSAVIRAALTKIIESKPYIKVVKSISDGDIAVRAAQLAKPHVIILDIEMPVMDGLTALPQILKASPDSKVIMFSSLTEKGAGVTMEAMRLGAVECLVKPSSAQDVGEGSPFQSQLITLIENIAPVKVQKSALPDGSIAKKSLLSGAFSLYDDSASYKGKPAIVAIGSSTGGPQALFNVLKHCKGFDVPIVITQHMPATFTKILAEHIQQQTGITATEGADKMPLEGGKVYVAPGGKHMLFKRVDGTVIIELNDGPAINFCKPAVDPMLDSVVDIYGQRVLGVILTGMGHDGRDGVQKVVAQKGRVIAQDEETSVVWGMPGAAAQSGVCSRVLPLDDIGPWIKSAVIG